MRIGDFAKKYDMNVTAVRYYIENALLTPQKKNNQYIFDKSCIDDMNKILEYKECGLTLEEIELMFFLEKTSKFQDETILQIVQDLFEEKIDGFKEEQAKIQKSIELLEEQLNKFSSIQVRRQQDDSAGIPFSFIPYLYCPKCGAPLSMDNTKIQNGHLYEGEMTCTCGYHSVISEGIILCDDHDEEDTPFKWFNNIDSVYSATDEYSGVYRILLDKGALYMYQNIPESEFPQMIMFGPFTCNCLLRFCNDFDKKHIYVVIDPSLKRIKRLQEYLLDSDLQLIFMAGGIDEVPLRKGSIDIYMDDYSVTNSLCTYGSFIYDKIHAFLKETGLLIGLVGDYKDAPKSLQNIKKDHPDYPTDKMPPSKFKANMTMNGFELQEMKTVGSTHGNEMHFPRNEVGEQVSMLGYTAIKK
ncbi:MAG: MerR family transcriptional regulator [Anaerolineaceae bacterium]|nr:MerR family transcriptional regulator [Anaerolineaceae bacterium]